MSTPYRRNAKTPAGRIAATPSTANWGGFFGLLQKYEGAAAGYSLRKIGSGPVVRLRRASDSAERDFVAGELTGSSEGAELVSDPDFDTGSPWITTGGWSITGGQAVNSGTDGTVQLSGGIPSGEYVIATIDVVACSNFADLKIRVGADTAYSLSSLGITTTGTHKIAAQTQNTALMVATSNSATATIEFLGCKEYTPTSAELWVIESEGNTTNLFATVRYWYDQSGNGNHAGQSTANAQPKLITAGVTETDNGKPAMVFDGGDDYLNLGTDQLGNTELFADSSDRFSVFSVSKATTGTVFSKAASSSSLRNFQIAYLSGNFFHNIRGAGTHITGTIGVQNLRVVNWDGSSAVAHIDGGGGTPLTVGSSAKNTTDINIGSRTNGNFVLDGSIQEIIVYDSDQSTNRVGIETNINDHYGIY